MNILPVRSGNPFVNSSNYITQKEKRNVNDSNKNSYDYSSVAYPKNYYFNNLSFGACSYTPSELIKKIGEENFPNQEIVRRLSELEDNHDFSLYDVHRGYYGDILDCENLEEVKIFYPEFEDVVDAKDVDLSKLHKYHVLKKIANGEIEGIDIENLSFEILKKYYGGLHSPMDKDAYWGLSDKAVRRLTDLLKIKRFTTQYSNRLYTQSPEFRERLSAATKENWANPDSVFNTKEHREKMAQATAASWKKPEIKKRRSDGLQKHWDNNPERKEALTQMLIDMWADPNSVFNSEEFRNERSRIKREQGADPNSVYNSEEYKSTMKRVHEAHSLAFRRHPEIVEAMREVANDFPRLGILFAKEQKNEELTDEEKKYLARYYKMCERKCPGYKYIIGEEWHRILGEWRANEE